MRVRLLESDEFMHPLGPETNFNESMYINCFDHASKLGVWLRMGNRANEGYAEMTVCIYLPDGRVGFMFNRPNISHNDALDAGGLTWKMHTPFEHLSVDFAGKVLMLTDPYQMSNPREAFKNNPFVECEVHLDFRGKGRPSMFGGEPEEPHERPEEQFARGHYEQLVTGNGSLRVGSEEFAISGFGLRDHSWGPRFWQAPWYYRWLTANFRDDLGFMASRVARKDSGGTRGGFVWDAGQIHLCDGVQISTVTHSDEHFHKHVTGTLSSTSAKKSWSFEGQVRTLIPLRNRRQDPAGNWMHTRISEGMTEWKMTSGDHAGRIGYGMSEYLDQIIDSQPVGIAE